MTYLDDLEQPILLKILTLVQLDQMCGHSDRRHIIQRYLWWRSQAVIIRFRTVEQSFDYVLVCLNVDVDHRRPTIR